MDHSKWYVPEDIADGGLPSTACPSTLKKNLLLKRIHQYSPDSYW